MRFFRPALVGVALVVAFLGQSLLGQMSDGGSNGAPFDRLHFRSIGPSIMSGRISDFAAYEANTAIFYVATAHGGVWKTENNGATFTPIFEKDGLMSIGDVTVSQKDPNHVFIFEVYDNAAALDAHRATDHFKAYAAATKEMVAKRDVRAMSSVAMNMKGM